MGLGIWTQTNLHRFLFRLPLTSYAFGYIPFIDLNKNTHSHVLGLQCNDSTLQHCDYTPCDSMKDCGYSIEKLFAQYKVGILHSLVTSSNK